MDHKLDSKSISSIFLPLVLVTVIFVTVIISPSAFAATYQVVITAASAASKDCATTNNCFNPNTLNVNPGDTVTWTNADDYSHTTINGHPTDNKTGTVWDSSVIKAGGIYSFTFQNTGAYDYFCQIHPWMIGQVIVGNGIPASPAPTSSPITSSSTPSQVTPPFTPTSVAPNQIRQQPVRQSSCPPPTIPPFPQSEIDLLDKENDPNKLIIEGRAFLNSVISPVPGYFYFDKALKLEPTNSTAQKGKEEACNRIAQLEQSLSNADVQLSTNPQDQGALITKAQVLLLLGEYGQTSQSERASFDKALTNNSVTSVMVLEEQYRTLDLMGKYEETLPIIDKLIGSFAGQEYEESMYLQWKAISLYKLGRYDEASSVLDQSNQAAQAQPNGNPNIIYDIEKGIIYEKMGKQDLANTYYDLAGINPEAATNGKLDYIKGSIAMNPITMEDYETALEYLDKVPPSSSDYSLASIMKVVAQDRLAEASTIASINSAQSIQISATQPTQSEENGELKIPNWFRNDAKWWSQGSINDNEFVKGVQYMMQNGIMKVPKVQSSAIHASQIPSWVKTASGWWSSGQISDDEFVKGIQYLISVGIIQP